MKVLVACEFSGIVRDAFTAKGHDAMSCDLLPTEKPGKHYQGDVFDLDFSEFDLMIAHPPCTFIANSGVQHLHKNQNRWIELKIAVEFFKKIMGLPVSKIAIENPIPHRYAGLPKYNQIIQPWMFGNECTKATCLWLKNLPILLPTEIVGIGERYIGKDGKSNGAKWYQFSPSPDRQRERSRTFPGIANAMADQWGSL